MALIPQLRLWLPAYPGFKLFAYIAGSTTKQNTYSDSALLTPNANPVVADSGGLLGSVYLDPALSYKFVVAPSTDTDPPTSPLYTQDNVSGSNANTLTVLSKVASYAVASTDGDDVAVLVDATLGAVTISLYTAIGNSGKKVRVVKTDASTNAVTIDPSGSQTWMGATTFVLSQQWASVGGSSDGANWQQYMTSNTPMSLGIPQGRLTLTTGTPVTTADVSAAVTLFYTPYVGNQIPLYDGSTRFNPFTFSELSITLVGLTASKNYDVFVFNSAGTPTLELLVWTNATTRATALAYQNGYLVKSGTPTRLYVGTIWINASGGQADDTLAKRSLWNYYNRVERAMSVYEGTASWTYSTNTWRQANASTTNQLDYVIGVNEEMVAVDVVASGTHTGNSTAAVGIGIDVTNAPFASSAYALVASSATAGGQFGFTSSYRGYPGLGRHVIAWLELSGGAATMTWTGVSASSRQSGIMGFIRG